MKMLQYFTCHFRLDYHGVADLFEPTEQIVDINKYQVCVISYIGTHSERRIQLRQEFMKRIESKQITFGIINFVRSIESKTTTIFTEPGSKAWINSLIKVDKNAVFIDDSIDHINSLQSMKIPGLQSKFFKGTKTNLIKLINDVTLSFNK